MAEETNYKLRFFEEASEETEEGIELPYIHLTILDVNVNCFLRRTGDYVIFTLTHESLPQGAVESFLKDLPLERADCESGVAFECLQDLNDVQIAPLLHAITEAISVRCSILALLESFILPDHLTVTFSPQEANALLVSSTGEAFVAGQIDTESSSITWSPLKETIPYLEDINALALKFRSTVDCLQAQLLLLIERESLNSQ